MAPQYDYLQEVATSIPCPSRSQFCSNNVEMLDSSNNKYRRCLFIRYVPGEISTPDTSAEGLRVLAAFLKDNICSRYPPADITTIDGTNVENPHSLDQFFMDNDTIDFIKTDFSESDLTSDFFERYPVLSRKLWAGPNSLVALAFRKFRDMWFRENTSYIYTNSTTVRLTTMQYVVLYWFITVSFISFTWRIFEI